MKNEQNVSTEMAFPQSTNPEGPFGGATLRDYFANAALPAVFDRVTLPETDKELKVVYREIAKQCYGIADAMLKQRDK